MNDITPCTWLSVVQAVDLMSRRYAPRNVFGIPRGGCTPAAMLATRWATSLLPEPSNDCLVVDDIIDSGHTVLNLIKHHNLPSSQQVVSIVSRPGDLRGIFQMEGWITFPWEANETGPEESVVRLLEYIGVDPSTEGLLDTPKRVLKSMRELTSGYSQDPEQILARNFDGNGYDEVVVLNDIRFTSLCEHHLLPFFGHASVAYIPKDGRIVGLSKLARLVDCYARRLQVQERMTMQIANTLEVQLEPRGVAVLVKAQHLCMAARGVGKPEAAMTTSVVRGAFRDKPEARAEVLRLFNQ